MGAGRCFASRSSSARWTRETDWFSLNPTPPPGKKVKLMTTASLDLFSETGPALPPIMPGKLILNGENPFIRLSDAPGDPFTTDASLWTITWSLRGAGPTPCSSGAS